MGKVLEQIDDRLLEFIQRQHLYFVGTAPSSDDGHINLSPKGHADTFSVVDQHTVAYLDLTGSGAESIAHLRENGRIVIMFCAFDGPPQIVRLHGRGRVVTPGDDEWAGLFDRFPDRPGARAIVVVDVTRISDSCGQAVPLYDYVADRDLLYRWAERKSDEQLDEYHRTRNATSIDGLPGLPAPRRINAP
ncbi:MAG TPA: pyridoxamine 5'-phosphate oxidase family protein [Actinomycetes bacterium]|nr:pyridoxamine 5'-phosphate oxidase family protein [Actinomycetes bacterium]